MKKIVERERNKTYYRVLHLPIWIWVFFILPGHLTYSLYLNGPDRRHGWWLAAVTAVCIWRGIRGRLPGVEPRPYITHYGLDQPNLPYRVVCYTAAWIDLFVPFALNLISVLIAGFSGRWMIAELYTYLYYPLALLIVGCTALDWTPRAKRSTRREGVEKAWFYVAIWTVVPAQTAAWAAWRMGGRLGFEGLALNRLRLVILLLFAGSAFALGVLGKLPRSSRYRLAEPAAESS